MFKVNNKKLERRFTPFYSVSVLDFKQVNVGWD